MFSATHPFLDPPKYANITGLSGDEYDADVPIQLSCHGTSVPAVHLYKWYKKRNNKSKEEPVQSSQNLTVNPDRPGIYHCHAANSIGGTNSNQVQLFLNSQYSFLILRYGLVLRELPYRSLGLHGCLWSWLFGLNVVVLPVYSLIFVLPVAVLVVLTVVLWQLFLLLPFWLLFCGGCSDCCSVIVVLTVVLWLLFWLLSCDCSVTVVLTVVLWLLFWLLSCDCCFDCCPVTAL